MGAESQHIHSLDSRVYQICFNKSTLTLWSKLFFYKNTLITINVVFCVPAVFFFFFNQLVLTLMTAKEGTVGWYAALRIQRRSDIYQHVQKHWQLNSEKGNGQTTKDPSERTSRRNLKCQLWRWLKRGKLLQKWKTWQAKWYTPPRCKPASL